MRGLIPVCVRMCLRWVAHRCSLWGVCTWADNGSSMFRVKKNSPVHTKETFMYLVFL